MTNNLYNPSNSGPQIITPGSGSPGSIANSDISRILPRQISSGTMRGTQNVGYGSAKIDGSNNRITVGGADGSTVGMGNIPNTTNEFGFFTINSSGNVTYKVVNGVQYFYDDAGVLTYKVEEGVQYFYSAGNLIQKVQAGTTYVYNPTDGFVNVTQSGLLPDGSGGFVVAKSGQNVSSAYS